MKRDGITSLSLQKKIRLFLSFMDEKEPGILSKRFTDTRSRRRTAYSF